MGTTWMKNFCGYKTAKDYFDKRLFTWSDGESSRRVVASYMVGEIYYAAVEKTWLFDQSIIIGGVVVVTETLPDAVDGYTFGFRDYTENCEPYYWDCPAAILKRLTKTKSEPAIRWRKACHDRLAENRAARKKATPDVGDTLVFDTPLEFNSGEVLTTFVVVKLEGRRAFESIRTGRIYCISNLNRRSFTNTGKQGSVERASAA